MAKSQRVEIFQKVCKMGGHMRVRLALAVFGVLASFALPARAATVAFWDFNGSSLVRTAGTSGDMSVEVINIGEPDPEPPGSGYVGYGPGTTVNSGGYPAGESLELGSFINIVGVGYITLDDLNFTDLSQPTLSFAWKKDQFVTFFESFSVEYNTGSGWQTATDLGEPTNGFTTATYTFAPGVLNNQSDVSIRLHFVEVVDIVSHLNIDNVTVTAVPEPGTATLLALGGLGLLARRRRKTLAV
jgi:hypothetical protein